MFINTMESRLLNPQGELKLVREIEGKNVVFDYKEEERLFFQVIGNFERSDGSRNRDFAVKRLRYDRVNSL